MKGSRHLLVALSAGALLLAGVAAAQTASGTEGFGQAARAQVPAPEPARVAAARKIVDVMLPPEQRARMFDASLNATLDNIVAGVSKADEMQALFETEPRARAIFDEFVDRQRQLGLDDLNQSVPELLDAFAKAYARRFTAAELDQLGVFFATPLGQKYARLSRELLADPDIARWQQGIARRAQERLPGELQRLIDALEALKPKDEKPDAS